MSDKNWYLVSRCWCHPGGHWHEEVIDAVEADSAGDACLAAAKRNTTLPSKPVLNTTYRLRVDLMITRKQIKYSKQVRAARDERIEVESIEVMDVAEFVQWMEA